jgi:hypothetical protein
MVPDQRSVTVGVGHGRKAGIPGRSKMTKRELAKALEQR